MYDACEVPQGALVSGALEFDEVFGVGVWYGAGGGPSTRPLLVEHAGLLRSRQALLLGYVPCC